MKLCEPLLHYCCCSACPPTSHRAKRPVSFLIAAATLLAIITLPGNVAASSTLTANRGSVAFGTVIVGTSSKQAVTLTNSGSRSVNISKVSIEGARFNIGGLSTPLVLLAGHSASFVVSFNPTGLGTVMGSLVIQSDAPNSTPAIALSGTGVKQLSVSSPSISFGDVAVGEKNQHTVALTNHGSATISISRVSVVGAGFTATTPGTPLSLAAGTSIVLAVQFAPRSTGTVNGSITVESSASGSAVTVNLSGTGSSQRSLSATPSVCAFGEAVRGSTDSQTIRLGNSGSSSITVSSATVSGKDFRVVGLGVPRTIASGQSATFNVEFTPSVSGNEAGSLSIVSNATNSPLVIPLSGTGVTGTFLLGATPSALSFGTVGSNNPKALTLILTNNGNSNVTVSGVGVSGAGFSRSGTTAGVTLAPDQSTPLTIVFAPLVAGNVTGTVTVMSNATNSPTKISLSGTGSLPSSHSVALDWDSSTSLAVVGYNVYRGTTSGGPYTKLTPSEVSTTQYADTSVQAGHVYYYVVRAVDSRNSESLNSQEASAQVPNP